MKKLQNIITSTHKQTSRNHLARMMDDKIACMKIARKFDKDFWDGKRRFGYGGYHYDGRYEVVAKKLIEAYNLNNNSKILDVGCGKGFILYEIKKLLPKCTIHGFDLSSYAIENSKPEIKELLYVHKAEDSYPYSDKEFDLVMSITTLHNLKIFDLKKALQEIERVGKNKYIVVEGYRNEEELFNLQCWALTCECFFTPDEWV
ncbi:MAG: methyltransferase type 11, partial [uncultured bacterium]